eukprot:TRINITY_DN4844_c0_g1_i3.p1 TRINITY_DN4844_c0_g1~~TRINITY_DN4844_c0_g1_i3.p1  ORF type:complete len:249 (-),score=49.18 TRINITY_DN4844_c0_g1_i3:128-874(-)
MSIEFRHFIDRGIIALMQMYPLLIKDRNIKIIMSPAFNSHASVDALMKRMGLFDQVVKINPRDARNNPILIEQAFFGCVNPHYHPYGYQKFREVLDIKDQGIPTDRKKIIYMTRKGNSRGVTNENDVIQKLEELVKPHEAKYELVIFKAEKYGGIEKVIDLFQQAKAVIGPHGGALYNTLWCPSDAFVLEFFPIGSANVAHRWPEAIWWPDMFAGLTYYMVPLSSGGGEVNVPLNRLEMFLNDIVFKS